MALACFGSHKSLDIAKYIKIYQNSTHRLCNSFAFLILAYLGQQTAWIAMCLVDVTESGLTIGLRPDESRDISRTDSLREQDSRNL